MEIENSPFHQNVLNHNNKLNSKKEASNTQSIFSSKNKLLLSRSQKIDIEQDKNPNLILEMEKTFNYDDEFDYNSDNEYDDEHENTFKNDTNVHDINKNDDIFEIMEKNTNHKNWVDIKNSHDPKAASEVAKRIHEYALESEISLSTDKFLQTQNKISQKTRDSAIRWLIPMNHYFGFPEETLFLSIAYLDLFFQRHEIEFSLVRLLTVSCFRLAAKIDTHTPPTSAQIYNACHISFPPEKLLNMEIQILKVLDFQLNYPIIPLFLNRYLSAADASKEEKSVAIKLAELVIQHFDFMNYKYSQIACVCAFLTCAAFSNPNGAKQAVLISCFDDVPLFIELCEKIQKVAINESQQLHSEENPQAFSSCNFEMDFHPLCL